MPKKPQIPPEILKEMELGEARPLEGQATLIQDEKYTKQFSVKIPRRLIGKLGWKAGDRITLTVEDGVLVLKR